MADLGTDVQAFPGLDPFFRPASGQRAVAEIIYRRCYTERGKLPLHPDDGLDLSDLLNEALDEVGLARIRAMVAEQARRDERVLDVEVEVIFDSATETVQIPISFTTAEGPFSFVLKATALTVELLST